MKKTYGIVTPADESFYEVYEEAGEYYGDFVCRCNNFEDAKEICIALEDVAERAERVVKGLTLGQLLRNLQEPDHTPTDVLRGELEVVFDTAYRSDLTLLSCYVSKSDGKVHIDIGTGEE